MKDITWTKGIGKHKNGSWYIRVRQNGHEITKAFPTKSEAEVALKALRTQKAAAQLGLTTNEPGATLGPVIDRYVGDARVRGLSPVTLTDYTKVGKRLVDHFGARHHVRIQQREVMDYVKSRRDDGAGAALITRELKLLGTFIKHGAGISYLTWSVPRLHDADEAAQKPVLTDEQVATVYRAIKRPEIQRAFLLGLLCALRPSDVFSLQSTDIAGNNLQVGMRKRRGSPITIPMVGMVKSSLEGVEGQLCASAYAVKMYLQRKTRPKKGKPLLNGIGILRPTAATWASEAGYADDAVDVLLGHAQWTLAKKHYIRSTVPLVDPYTQLRLDMLTKVEERFLKALKA